jgi:hypothetical protein
MYAKVGAAQGLAWAHVRDGRVPGNAVARRCIVSSVRRARTTLSASRMSASISVALLRRTSVV